MAIGYPKLTFTHNSPTALKRIATFKQTITRSLEGLFARIIPEWQSNAKLIIETVIYDAYTPKTYKRTGNLRRAVRTHVSNSREAKLFIDGDLIPDKSPGGYGRGYAAYFIKGTGFLNRVQREFLIDVRPLRDFMGDSDDDINQWIGMTLQFFESKYREIFNRATKIANATPETISRTR